MFVESDKKIGKLIITGHAIDRATTRCKSFYRRYKRNGEGSYSWLVRMSFEALKYGGLESQKIQYKGMLFAFSKDEGTGFLKLVSLMLANKDTIKKVRKKERKKK